MAELEPFFCCRSIFILCITSFILLRMCDAQLPNPCTSNLEDSGDVQEGINVFLTPGARVAQGTDIIFLCCFYTETTRVGFSVPIWTIEPNSDVFIIGRPAYAQYRGKNLVYRYLNATAKENINNTRVRCSSSNDYESNWTKIVVMGKLSFTAVHLMLNTCIYNYRYTPTN